MNLQQPPVVKTEMLIRKPAAEVYRSFVDPAVPDHAPDKHVAG
jgi:uncharacterized protein YndB with AHSA1/START domain